MQIVLDVLYFMNCLPTNIQTNESLTLFKPVYEVSVLSSIE